MSPKIRQWLANQFMFFPEKTVEYYPGQWDLPFEEVAFRSDHGHTLQGWFLPSKPAHRTILYYHGNAGNRGGRLPKLKKLHGTGSNIFIFDYRGYGGSEGEPTIEGVVEDSLTAYRYLASRSDVMEDHIILYGESLGGAMALQVSEKEKYAGMILESTFTSIRDMARHLYPIVPSGLVLDVYRSIDIIRRVHEPLLVMHGKRDSLIPFRMGEELHAAAPPPKRFVPIEEADHSDIYEVDPVRAVQAVEEFLVEIGE